MLSSRCAIPMHLHIWIDWLVLLFHSIQSMHEVCLFECLCRGSVLPRECAAVVLELKNRPSPRSPSLTSPVAVMKTLAGFISGTHTNIYRRTKKWERINEKIMCVCIRKKVSEFTSMHDSAWVHVFQRAAQLHKILPYRSFRNQPPLLLKILHTCQGYYQ